MDAAEQPHQHPAHTGHSWLDVVLALTAMFVSVVSLVVAIEHGRTMERMADANTRMVGHSSPSARTTSMNMATRTFASCLTIRVLAPLGFRLSNCGTKASPWPQPPP